MIIRQCWAWNRLPRIEKFLFQRVSFLSFLPSPVLDAREDQGDDDDDQDGDQDEHDHLQNTFI